MYCELFGGRCLFVVVGVIERSPKLVSKLHPQLAGHAKISEPLPSTFMRVRTFLKIDRRRVVFYFDNAVQCFRAIHLVLHHDAVDCE